jgi:hypothetical protein
MSSPGRFSFEDIYAFSMGKSIKEEAVVDAENQSALAENPSKSLGSGKIKTYNILSAFIALVTLLILIQVFR